MEQTNTDYTALRGLDARIAWAGRGHTLPGTERVDMAFTVCMLAVDQGFRDFRAGRCMRDVPPLLADVPDLADAWLSGWSSAEALDLIDDCVGAEQC